MFGKKTGSSAGYPTYRYTSEVQRNTDGDPQSRKQEVY